MTYISPSVHDLATWGKARLDELDATVNVMEARTATLSGDTRLQAHLALLDAFRWREAFYTRARGLRHITDREVTRVKSDLDHAWKEFELAFHRWVQLSGGYVAELRARTRTQVNSWMRFANEHSRNSAADIRIADEKRDNVLRTSKELAAKQIKRLEKLQHAGASSYRAWSEALSRSRLAFEEALQITQAKFAAVP